MASDEDISATYQGHEDQTLASGRRARRRAILWFLAAVLAAGALAGWLTRERIADNIISGQLEKLGVPATYRIESIGAGRQVITDLVVGDPNHPDLTIERVILEPKLRFGVPGIGRLTLVKPRLYGTYLKRKFSFGSLDPVIFAPSEQPFRLPDFALAVQDGRALIESDYGAMGIKAEGGGQLRDGFSGTVAAVAPSLEFEGCSASGVSLYGSVTIDTERPRFKGPVRLASLRCPESGARIARAAIAADLNADKALDGGEGTLRLKSGPVDYAGNRVAGTGADARFAYRKGLLTARYTLQGSGVSSPQVLAARLDIEGRVRAFDDFARLDVEGDVTGDRLNLGRDLDRSLGDLAAGAKGSLAADVIDQLRGALRREGRQSRLKASFIMRRTSTTTSLVVPTATVTGTSGSSLLSVSRLQVGGGDAVGMRISGNFATGGPQMPRIAGRMEATPGGQLVMHIRMPEYRAGSARLALPQLMVAQARGGGFGFAGEAQLSGALPGGSAENLVVPIEGNWSARGGLSLWRKCSELRFDRLQLAQLALDHRKLTICPPVGGAIVRTGKDGFKAAGGVSGLNVAGRLGGTPVRIESGPVGFAWPGFLHAREVEVALGPAETASRFRLARLDARLGGAISGTFEGTDVLLDAVPLDILDTSGNWRYADGALTIDDGTFRLEDREQVDRFQPLAARGAALRLADNVVTADAILREPRIGREVLRTALVHDLATGKGSANLFVDSLRFDDRVQPDTLTGLALGVIANAQGTVRGDGRIDWNEQAVTSTGRFTTDSLDFAAAFGPVHGLSGTVHFTDLLGLVTAPEQKLRVASVNPGIEVEDGTLTFALRPGNILGIEGARWPFQGGTLTLEPVNMAIGTDHVIRYVLDIDGLDAALFVQHLELGNIAATGTFDGKLPLVFDENGGRIDGGYLVSRPPGGNVSYVGELTYKDLSAMANFAFDALRSLDYRQMRIDLDGSLEGEIVTRVTFDGIRQGKGASRNFVTKQVAKLPIRFKVNIRAPFFQLVTSVRSLYDPEYIRDPRTIGILDALGAPRPPLSPEPSKPAQQPAVLPQSVPIQRPESEDMP